MPNKFGDMVRLARIEKGWSQRELARRIKKSATYINYVESGRNPSSADNVFTPARDAVEKIAGALDLDTDEALMASGYAPEQPFSRKPPQTLEELLEALNELGVEQINFFDQDKMRNASPEELQRTLEAIRLAVELTLNRGANNDSHSRSSLLRE